MLSKIKKITKKSVLKFMQVVFSIGAALRSEKVKTAKRINQCESFIKLAIVAEGLENPRTDEGKNIISFDCDEFKIDEKWSSKNWENLFPYKKNGKCVVINVPENYILGPTILGYH